jgi:DNA polymerase I-like protein with 3'-5' exonuclease and polymerase domains/uracil-DNA glycosylase
MIPLGSGDGPSSARVMIVGEMWGHSELREGRSFAGSSGEEMNRMLHDAGILRSECWVTNVVNAMPPAGNIDVWIPSKKRDIRSDMVPLRGRMVEPCIVEGIKRLQQEIRLVKPNVIIAMGNTALWALTGKTGVQKWRGSQLRSDREFFADQTWKVIPTIHPAAVMREWGWRKIVVQDLKRCAREKETPNYTNEPKWNFTIRPSFEQVIATLNGLIVTLDATGDEGFWLDFDLETQAGHIETCGFSWSLNEGICIPFMCREDKHGYWATEQMEGAIVHRCYRIMTHPRVKVRGQNLLYDAQYTYRHWHFVPRVVQDTMIAQHSIYCRMRKSLDFQASMYCDHYVYWKDDGKVADLKVPQEQRWTYNVTDCVRTREVGEVEAKIIKSYGLEKVDEFQQKMFWPVLQCMQRGVRIDQKLRNKLSMTLLEEVDKRQAFFQRALGHPLNPRSPTQMTKLFYDDLGQKKNWKVRGKGMPATVTCDDAALEKIAREEPILKPFIKKIQEIRSLGVFLSTFVLAPLDYDGRMRTSYNICGTVEYRFSSSENAFGSGTNLQNVPKGGEDDEGFDLPNIRDIFIPDEGYEMFDKDLSKADLRIVTWESDCKEMKALLKAGKDPYIEAAREYYRDPTITKLKPDGSTNKKYDDFKKFAHGTHYLGTPSGLASRIGLLTHEVDRGQRWYFGKFPEIKKWQEDFQKKLFSQRYIENIFGYRCHFFDRPDDSMVREAIAWLPASTVALYINRIWMNIYERFPHIWVLLQVHDSLVGQYPIHRREEALKALEECSQIVLPYDDPLIIPTGTKTSDKSWGACG